MKPTVNLKVILVGLIGNLLEWYDFAVYGYFASIFAKQFFPSNNHTLSLVSSFGAFAAGFLMRPVGAVLVGSIADKKGRKKALNTSVLLMAIPTFIIGILPGYASIGVLAPILLVLMRMLQGISVGGEYTSSLVYLSECAPPKRKALFSSMTLVGSSSGILLGSYVSGVISQSMSESNLMEWGWRIPFIIGIGLAFFGFILRKDIPETYDAHQQTESIFISLKKHINSILHVCGIMLAMGISFYTVFVFLATWLEEFVQEPRTLALQINSIGILVMIVCIPLSGWASDKWGGKKILMISTIALIIFTYPILLLMHHHNETYIEVGQILFAIIIGTGAGPIPILLSNMFPKHIRVTSVGLGYNSVYALFGGTSPIIALWMINKTHDDLSFAWYIIGAGAITLFSVMRLKVSD